MKAFLALTCSLALACVAGGQEENKSKPAPKQAQTAQRAVTAGGESSGAVDTRQLMMQTQHDPSAKTKKNMKGSQSQQAAGRPETMDKMMRAQHYHDEMVTGLKGTGAQTSPRALVGRNDGHVQQPSQGAEQGQGKRAGGNKTSVKVSPTPRPR